MSRDGRMAKAPRSPIAMPHLWLNWVFLTAAAAALGCASAPGPPAHVERSGAGTTEATAKTDSGRVVCNRILEDFSGADVGAFPLGWRAQGEDDPAQVAAKSLYVVEQVDGRRVLHAKFLRETVTIALVVDGWDLAVHPILQWQWMAVSLPDGGKETDSSLNDTGAAVYAIWHIGFPFYLRGIKYAWSCTLPVGTRSSKRFGYDQMLVVESGPERLGTWQTVRVDVRSHFQQFFDRTDASGPTGIAVMTDADATASQAEAYYADFRLCSLQQGDSRTRATGAGK